MDLLGVGGDSASKKFLNPRQQEKNGGLACVLPPSLPPIFQVGILIAQQCFEILWYDKTGGEQHRKGDLQSRPMSCGLQIRNVRILEDNGSTMC